MAAKQKDVLTISIKVSPKEYELHHNLTEKQKNLRKLFRLVLIAAASEESFGEVLEISSEIKLSNDTEEFIRELIGDMNLKKIAKKTIGLLLTMKNMLSCDPHLTCRDFWLTTLLR